MKSYPPYKIFLTFVLVFFFIVLFFLIRSGGKSFIDDLFSSKIGEKHEQEIAKKSRTPEIPGTLMQSIDDTDPALDPANDYDSYSFPDFINLKEIEYPAGNNDILGQLASSLLPFDSCNTQIRILFYGDSQLEGDRITAQFRKSLRDQYGGSGPGMVSLCEPNYPSKSVQYKSSRNWTKHDFLINKKPQADIGLGTMLSYSRFEGLTAFVKVSTTSSSANDGLLFDRFRLFIQPGEDEGTVKLLSADSLHAEWNVSGKEGIVELDFTFPDRIDELTLDFENMEGASMMGLSMESVSGVQVDNIAHRGSAGLEFSRDKTNSFMRMADMILPDLIILHFGINVVPAKSDDFSYYGRMLQNEILLLQDRIPDVPVLLIGVSDMGHTVQGVANRYAAVELVNEIQREVARKTGAAFFDLFNFPFKHA